MIGLLIGVAVLAAVAAVSARWLRKKRIERTRPGVRPELAIAIRDYNEMDEIVRRQRCSCGGWLDSTGEGPFLHGITLLRMTVLECSECGRERRLYFDVSTVRH